MLYTKKNFFQELFEIHLHQISNFLLKKDPAYCPDRLPPAPAAGIPALSYSKAEIPAPVRCQAPCPLS